MTDDDDLTMGEFIDYSHARLEYSRCRGRGCIVRRRSGPDFYCSLDCMPAEMRADYYQRFAAALNAVMNG